MIGITYDSQWNSYTESVIPFSVFVGSLFLLSVLLFQCALCFRVCFNCCVCGPRPTNIYNKDDENKMQRVAIVEKNIVSRQRIFIAFVLFFVLVLIVNNGLAIGMSWVYKGVDTTARDALDYIQDTFVVLVDTGNDLELSGNNLDEKVNGAVPTCQEASVFNEIIVVYEKYVQDYIDIVAPVPGSNVLLA